MEESKALRKEILEATNTALDDNTIWGREYPSAFLELLYCVMAQKTFANRRNRGNLARLALTVAQERGSKYLGQAIKANKKYDDLKAEKS